MRAIFLLILFTLIPTLELRYSIPHGYVNYRDDLSVAAIIGTCLAANIALAPVVWVFLDKAVHVFLRIGWINNLYDRLVGRAQKNLHKYVERWGTLGLALFIGVPLPGSGVYSGALGAYVLGFTFRQFFIASVLGVLIAGSLVSTVVLSSSSAFAIFTKSG
ncbi:MAG: putative membrane protein [Hyphomicrobiaceae bacterium]